MVESELDQLVAIVGISIALAMVKPLTATMVIPVLIVIELLYGHITDPFTGRLMALIFLSILIVWAIDRANRLRPLIVLPALVLIYAFGGSMTAVSVYLGWLVGCLIWLTATRRSP